MKILDFLKQITTMEPPPAKRFQKEQPPEDWRTDDQRLRDLRRRHMRTRFKQGPQHRAMAALHKEDPDLAIEEWNYFMGSMELRPGVYMFNSLTHEPTPDTMVALRALGQLGIDRAYDIWLERASLVRRSILSNRIGIWNAASEIYGVAAQLGQFQDAVAKYERGG